MYQSTPAIKSVVPDFPKPFLFWCIAFTYSTFLALILQKLILPLLPNLHAAHGLLQNDAIHFHTIAIQLAEKINQFGWSQWRLFPDAGATGNVGLLAALYAIFGPDPAWFIPFNAAAHATGALMIYLLGRLLWPGRVGRLGGLIAAILFLIFPSALMWYGQNHKDAFAIAGMLLLLYVWLQALPGPVLRYTWIRTLSLTVVAIFLIGFVRPHYLVVLTGALACSAIVVLIVVVARRSVSRTSLGLMATIFIVVSIAAAYAPKDREVMGDLYENAFQILTKKLGSEEASKITHWQWHKTPDLPHTIDNLLERISVIRASFIAYNLLVGAGSQIDNQQAPQQATQALEYMPRALIVGMFSPFPPSWIERPNLFRMVGALETLLWYLLLPGVFVLMLKHSSIRLYTGIFFCLSLLLVFGYIFPNVGTLYRQRFGVLFFFILCGAIGWASILLNLLKGAISPYMRTKKYHSSSPQSAAGINAEIEQTLNQGMTTVASSGAIVLMLSAFSYIGFLVRDLLLVKNIGMGPHLDAYFTATMLPMFLVAFISQPLADAMTQPFLALVKRKEGVDLNQQQRLIGAMLTFSTILLFVMSIPFFVFPEKIIALIIDPHFVNLNEAGHMLRLFSCVFICSGVAVIGNAVLNSLHQSRTVVLAQLVVPIVTIIFILVAGAEVGAISAIYGMIAGQILNIIWLAYALNKNHLKFKLGPIRLVENFRKIRNNYALLALAALFTAVAIPINYAFAGNLDQGSVSAWAFGNKMTLLFTNMGNIIISAVVLPHIARLITHGRGTQLKGDMYFLFMTGTWLATLIALIIYAFSEPLVVALLESDQINHEQIIRLAWILKLGSLQLPFLFAITLNLKLAAASGISGRAVLATGIGLILNILLNFILVEKIGVLGIATATVLAAGVAAAFLTVTTYKQSKLSLIEVTALIGSWFILLGLGVALYFHSKAAIVAMGVVFIFLITAQWRLWRKHCQTQHLPVASWLTENIPATKSEASQPSP